MPDSSDKRGGKPATAVQIDELNALPAGTRFGELEILRTVGVGGFGIVYLAQDHALEREVAIKEYMPGQLAQRGDGSMVSVRSGSLLETFDIGRRSFVNEARLLARFDHRSLLKVYQFWEANGTAYMAMPYLQGQTLKQARAAMSERPTEAWMLRMLLPLLDALSLLHAASVFHRDIAPDNILLPDVGKDGGADPILLDFGAARRAIGDRTQTFTAILKPSYAPIEQYAESAGLRQGPWTDVYALGAVIHYLVLGRTPPPATTRAVADEYLPLASLGLAGVSPAFAAAVDWALCVRPAERPQSMAQLRAALLGELSPPKPVTHPSIFDPSVDPDRTVVAAPPRHESAYAPTLMQAPHVERSEPPVLPPPTVAAAAAANKAGSSKRLIALLGGLLVLAALAWWAFGPAGAKKQIDPAGPDASTAATALLPAPSAAVVAAAAPASLPGSAVAAPPPVLLATPKPAPSASPTLSTFPRPKPTPAPAQQSAALPPPLPRQDASLTQTKAPATSLASPASQAGDAAAASQIAAAAHAPSLPVDPRQTCGKRVFLAMTWCIDRECEKPASTGHAECVKLREMREQRGRN